VAPATGDYLLEEVPAIEQLGPDRYFEWFKDHAVVPATHAFVESHRPALEVVYEELVDLTRDLPGSEVTARKDRRKPGALGLKEPHKVEEKIYRKLVENRERWRQFRAGRTAQPGELPEEISMARARTRIFEASPQAPEALRDVAGLRIIVHDLKAMREADQRIRAHYTTRIIRYKDFLGPAYKGDGYRSIHFVVVARGKPVEVQLRTKAQHRWAGWSHDVVYKGRFKNHDEVRNYGREAGELLHRRELGRCPPPCTPPPCPVVLSSRGQCFDWQPEARSAGPPGSRRPE